MRSKCFKNGPRGGKRAEKRENRAEKREESVYRATRGDSLRFRGSVGGGDGGKRGYSWLPSRPRVSEGFGPWRLRKCCKVSHFRDVAISWIFASQ